MLSLNKILVLVAIILVIWYGFKLVGRLDRARKQAVRDKRDGAAGPGRVAQDMVKCPVCETFVQAEGSKRCGRNDCPYPA